MCKERTAGLVVAAVVAALGLGGCSAVARGGDDGGSAMPDVAALSSTEEVDCDFEAGALDNKPTCYAVSVPEDWSDPDPDDQVVVQVAVFSATGDAAVDDPVIYLDGGPGGNTLDALVYSEGTLVEPYIADRDVIMFDQRGVGRSTPTLDCDEVDEVSLEAAQGKIADDQLSERVLGAFSACYERLGDDGVNFSAYNSVASANDVEAIRVGLKYEQLNLLGISYGTRLGQTMMRLYPSSLRSVVLDSVMPVAADVQELIEVSAERSLRLVFEACSADEACAETYPTFEDDYFALLDQLDAEPAEIEVSDIDGSTYTYVVDGDDLVGLTFGALYDKTMFGSLPKLVDDAGDGKYDSIATLASIDLINSHFVSGGMHFTVECNEEVPFESAEDLEANLPTEPPYDRLAALEGPASYFEVCEQWEAGAAPDVENEPVSSDVPTLLLTGTFDPITPPSYAQQVADHLSDAHLIEFPTEGHGVAPSECGSEIVVEFLNDPTAAPDSSCVADVKPPAWVAESGDVTLVEFEASQPLPYSGVRPDGWDEQGPGTYIRQQSLDDQTAIVMQPTGGAAPDFVVSSLESMLEVEFSEGDPTDIDGQQWTTYGADDGSWIYRILVDPDSEFLVVFLASPDEFDELFETVAQPAAASLTLG